MKKVALLAASIAVITIVISCSKEKDQYFQAKAPLEEHVSSPKPDGSPKAFSNSLIGDTTIKFNSGEDDDKPIIMHRVNSGKEPLPNAIITMISNTDSLQSSTNSVGETLLELPRLGIWELKITSGTYSPLDTFIVVTDSFSVKTSNLHY